MSFLRKAVLLVHLFYRELSVQFLSSLHLYSVTSFRLSAATCWVGFKKCFCFNSDDGRTRLPFVHLTGLHRESSDASEDLENSAESRTGGALLELMFKAESMMVVGHSH